MYRSLFVTGLFRSHIAHDKQAARVRLLGDVPLQQPGEFALLHPSGQVAVEQIRLIGRNKEAAQPAIPGPATLQDFPAPLRVVPLPSKALLAIVIGNPHLSQKVGNGARAFQVPRRGVHHGDAEAIAQQMARLQLVAVTSGPMDVDFGKLTADAFQRFLGRHARDGEGLGGDRVAILEPGHADVVLAKAEDLGEPVAHVGAGHLALGDPQEGVFPLPARLIERDLLDHEVFGLGAQPPPNAGQVSADVGKLERVSDVPLVHAHPSPTSVTRPGPSPQDATRPWSANPPCAPQRCARYAGPSGRWPRPARGGRRRWSCLSG